MLKFERECTPLNSCSYLLLIFIFKLYKMELTTVELLFGLFRYMAFPIILGVIAMYALRTKSN
jgi:hypothetical protein